MTKQGMKGGVAGGGGRGAKKKDVLKPAKEKPGGGKATPKGPCKGGQSLCPGTTNWVIEHRGGKKETTR